MVGIGNGGIWFQWLIWLEGEEVVERDEVNIYSMETELHNVWMMDQSLGRYNTKQYRHHHHNIEIHYYRTLIIYKFITEITNHCPIHH